jgi:hypothetical protein
MVGISLCGSLRGVARFLVNYVIPNTPLVLFLSNLTPKMPMLQDPYANQTTTLQNITVMLILPLPQFHKISSVSTHLFAKPPMAFQVNTEASEVAVH